MASGLSPELAANNPHLSVVFASVGAFINCDLKGGFAPCDEAEGLAVRLSTVNNEKQVKEFVPKPPIKCTECIVYQASEAGKK